MTHAARLRAAVRRLTEALHAGIPASDVLQSVVEEARRPAHRPHQACGRFPIPRGDINGGQSRDEQREHRQHERLPVVQHPHVFQAMDRFFLFAGLQTSRTEMFSIQFHVAQRA